MFENHSGRRDGSRARNRKLAGSAIVIAACYTILQLPDAFQLFLNTGSLRRLERAAFTACEICKIFISQARCTKPVLWTTITGVEEVGYLLSGLFLTRAIPLRNGSW